MDAVGIILSTVKVEISDQPCGDLQQNFGFFGFFRFLRLRWCWLPRSLASASNSGFQAPQRGSPQVLPRREARATLDSSCFQGSKAYSRSGGVRDLHHRRAPGCWAEPSLNRIGVFWLRSGPPWLPVGPTSSQQAPASSSAAKVSLTCLQRRALTAGDPGPSSFGRWPRRAAPRTERTEECQACLATCSHKWQGGCLSARLHKVGTKTASVMPFGTKS